MLSKVKYDFYYSSSLDAWPVLNILITLDWKMVFGNKQMKYLTKQPDILILFEIFLDINSNIIEPGLILKILVNNTVIISYKITCTPPPPRPSKKSKFNSL